MPHHRRSVRLRDHAYRGGLYAVTICTAGRRPLFGTVADFSMSLSPTGQVAHDEWIRTGEVRPDVILDVFVVMPDHVHLLFGITGPDDDCSPRVGATRRVAPTSQDGAEVVKPNGPAPRSVGAVIGQYKSIVTKRVWTAHGRETGHVWQRGYYDRVVRHDREAEAWRRYILENPAQWHLRGEHADGHRI